MPRVYLAGCIVNIDVTQVSEVEHVFVSKNGAAFCHCQIKDLLPEKPCNLNLPSDPWMDLHCGGLVLDRKYQMWKVLEDRKKEYADV